MLNHSSRGTSTPHKCTTQSQVLMRLLICLHSIRQSQEICEHTKAKWSRINFIQNVSLIRKVPFQRHVTQVISSLRNTGPKKKDSGNWTAATYLKGFLSSNDGKLEINHLEEVVRKTTGVLLLSSFWSLHTWQQIRNKCFVWKLTSQINKLV